MEIAILGFLLKKSINEGKKDNIKELEEKLNKIDKSTEITSLVSSMFFNVILVITAVMMAYNKTKDKSKEIKIGSMIFAILFPIIYLICNIILGSINKIRKLY
jgi:hypothetical protein